MNKKLLLSLAISLIFVVSLSSQTLDCGSLLAIRKSTDSYKFDPSTMSLQCITGKSYDIPLILSPGKEYRISFFAGSVFDNIMNFRIVDTETGETLLDIPGENESMKKGTCALRPYYDYASGNLIYPYFEFFPEKKMNLKVIIDIPEYRYRLKINEADPELGIEERFEEITERRRGCISLFIQQRDTDVISCD